MSRLATLLFTAFLFACHPPQPGDRVILIGDSITAGDFYALWVQQWLPEVEVVNLGAWGTNTFSWRPETGNRYTTVQSRIPAEFCHVLLGTNDATMGFPPHAYANSMGLIRDALLEDGCGLIVLSEPPPHPFEPELVEEYAEALVPECDRPPRVRCGVSLSSLADPAYLLEDNVHPTAEGSLQLALLVLLNLSLDPMP